MSAVKNIVEKQIAENPVVVYSKSNFPPAPLRCSAVLIMQVGVHIVVKQNRLLLSSALHSKYTSWIRLTMERKFKLTSDKRLVNEPFPTSSSNRNILVETRM